MAFDPDMWTRMAGIDPEKQRERELFAAELKRIQAETEAFRARALRAESEAHWGKIGAGAAALSAVVALIALLVSLL